MRFVLALLCASAACVGQVPGGDSPPSGCASCDAGAPATPDAAPGSIDAAPTPAVPDAAPAAGPGDGVVFLPYPEQRGGSDPSWGDVLTDIERHLPPEYGNTYRDADLITWAHETTHGINSELRNYHNDTGRRANGFYVLDDRAVIVVEPDIRKSDVAAYVPQPLRGSRFGLYVTGSTAWDDTPLYLYDEWVAYTNGGETGVDLVDSGLWTQGWRDGVAGQLEFTVYALATAMAVEERDPAYFTTNTQFREFTAWNARRAMDVYRRGAVMPAFSWDVQDAYYQQLRAGTAGAPIREFARRTYGDAWTRDVLGAE